MAQIPDDSHHQKMMTGSTGEVVCPVTNKVMKTADAPESFTFYFASEAAKEAFVKNPAKYLTATCPVMGGEASKLTATFSNYDGVAYYFCCDGCKEKFDKEPKKYIGNASQQSDGQDHSDATVAGAKASGQTCPGMTGGTSAAGHSCSAAGASCSATCPGMKASAKLVSDPVCGMQFTPSVGMKTTYKDTDYHFCSEGCKVKFEKDPEKYTKK
jgi:Cu+-exporting ATPase